jgi:hypothetical protein
VVGERSNDGKRTSQGSKYGQREKKDERTVKEEIWRNVNREDFAIESKWKCRESVRVEDV